MFTHDLADNDLKLSRSDTEMAVYVVVVMKMQMSRFLPSECVWWKL